MRDERRSATSRAWSLISAGIVWEAMHAGYKVAFVHDNTGNLVESMPRIARADDQQKEAESR